MASNLAKCRDLRMVYCTINTAFNRHWRDFTLQRGHVYGYSPELDGVDGMNGMFVVYRERRDRIELYVSVPTLNESGTLDHYEWHKHAIHKDTRTGREILRVLGQRIGGVEFKPLWQQSVKHVYNPPIMVGCRYTPMPNMRIPGGTYKSVLSEETHFAGIGKDPDQHQIAIKNIEDIDKWQKRKLTAAG